MNKKQIGEIVAAERASQGLTQVQLGEKIGVRRQAIIEMEQNQFDYRVDRLLQVLDGLGLTLIIAKKDSEAPIVATTDGDMFVFKKVKPLLEDPDVKKKTKKR